MADINDNSEIISVIIPVYNVEKYIRECLDSIVNQTYIDLEIITVDDGSIDNSGFICDEYATQDNRIKVIHKKNGGLSSALNEGLAAATGKYLAFIDSDDWQERDTYEYALKNMKRVGADMAIWQFYNVYQKNMTARYFSDSFILSREKALEELLLNDWMKNYHWNKLFIRSMFSGIHYPNGRTFEDIPVTYQLFDQCDQIIVLDGIKLYYRQREGSITKTAAYKDYLYYCMGQSERYNVLKDRYPQFKSLMMNKYMQTFREMYIRKTSLNVKFVNPFTALYEGQRDFIIDNYKDVELEDKWVDLIKRKVLN
jgi:glycosyltransferase involved in cell wall biosynthesis